MIPLTHLWKHKLAAPANLCFQSQMDVTHTVSRPSTGTITWPRVLHSQVFRGESLTQATAARDHNLAKGSEGKHNLAKSFRAMPTRDALDRGANPRCDWNMGLLLRQTCASTLQSPLVAEGGFRARSRNGPVHSISTGLAPSN